MAKQKNLSALFDQPFTLTDSEGREWEMKPPNKQRGMSQAVLYAGIQNANRQGGPCKACGQVKSDGLEPKTARAWEALQERELEEVVLGKKLYDEMIEADVAASDMHWMAMYAMWYWVLGEETADLLADTYAQSKYNVSADGTPMDEDTEKFMDPKDPVSPTPPPSPSGPSTE